MKGNSDDTFLLRGEKPYSNCYSDTFGDMFVKSPFISFPGFNNSTYNICEFGSLRRFHFNNVNFYDIRQLTGINH